MSFYADKIYELKENPFFTYGAATVRLTCPTCGAQLVSGKGDTLKCPQCSFRALVSPLPDQQRNYALALLKEGRTLIQEGDFKRALTRLRKAEKTLKPLLPEKNPDDQEILSEIYQRMAQAYSQLEDERAFTVEKKAASILVKLLRHKKRDIWLLMLANTYEDLSQLALAKQPFDVSVYYLDKTRETLKQAYKEASEQNRAVMAHVVENRWKETGQWLKHLADHNDKKMAPLFWSLALKNDQALISLYEQLKKDFPDQRKLYEKRKAQTARDLKLVRAKIPDDFSMEEILQKYTLVFAPVKESQNKAQTKPQKNQPKPAKPKTPSQSAPEKKPVQNEKRPEEKPSANLPGQDSKEIMLVKELSRRYIDLARAQIGLDQIEPARESLKQCLAFLDSDVFWQGKDFSDLGMLQVYSENLFECADLLEKAGLEEKALELYHKLFALLEPKMELDLLDLKAELAFKIAPHVQKQNRKEGNKYWQNALVFSQKLAREAKTPKEKQAAQERLYKIHEALGAADLERNRFKQGVGHYKKALSILEELIERDQNPAWLLLAHTLADKISQAYFNRKVMDQARKFENKAIAFENAIHSL